MKFAIIPFQNNKIFAGMYGAGEKLQMEWMLVEYTEAVLSAERVDKEAYYTDSSGYATKMYIRNSFYDTLDGYVVATRVLAYTGELNPASALSYIRSNKFRFLFGEGFELNKYFFEADSDEEAKLLFEVTEKY